MRNRTGLILGLAVLSGGAAAALAFSALSGSESTPKDKGSIVIAARDLPTGTVIGAGDVKLLAWPSETRPASYLTDLKSAINRGVIQSIQANEPVLNSKLADSSAGGGLSIAIPQGMRAMSVAVDEVIGVAGFIRPGARVDVLVTLPERDGKGETSFLVVQNVETLAVGQSAERDEEAKPTKATVITLLVSPSQAEKLTLAANEGRIQLALRNPTDRMEVGSTGTTFGSLIERPAGPLPAPIPRPAATRPVSPPDPGVEVIRGNTRSVTRP